MTPESTSSDSPVDLHQISEAYTYLLVSHYPKVSLLEHPSDWYLRLVWMPGGRPEVIYSISQADGKAGITLVRFLESAWQRFALAYRQGDEKVSVPLEIGKLDLPKTTRCATSSRKAHQEPCEDDPTPQHHGEEFRLFFQDGSGPYEAKI